MTRHKARVRPTLLALQLTLLLLCVLAAEYASAGETCDVMVTGMSVWDPDSDSFLVSLTNGAFISLAEHDEDRICSLHPAMESLAD